MNILFENPCLNGFIETNQSNPNEWFVFFEFIFDSFPIESQQGFKWVLNSFCMSLTDQKKALTILLKARQRKNPDVVVDKNYQRGLKIRPKTGAEECEFWSHLSPRSWQSWESLRTFLYTQEILIMAEIMHLARTFFFIWQLRG